VRDANTEVCDAERVGMPIQREREDAAVEEWDTERPGMQKPRKTNANTECSQVTKPVTQQQSERLANWCERRVQKLFQDKSTVGRTSNLL
jgi:hypothetical protein